MIAGIRHHAKLVVEVAVRSVDLDLAKGEIYAAGAIPEFWLVLPDESAMIAHSEPHADVYRQTRRLAAPELFASRTCPGMELDLGNLFDT
jgi:hypothetical protein